MLVKLDITKQHDSFFVTYEAFGSILEGVKFAAFGSKNSLSINISHMPFDLVVKQ